MEVREYLQLIGPNRRSERTVIEQQIVITPDELGALGPRLPVLRDKLLATLTELKAPAAEPGPEDVIRPDDVPGSLARLFTGTALALQRGAGHRVSQHGALLDLAGNGVWAWFEYEHDEVGNWASKLAWRVLAELEPGLHWEPADPVDGGDLFTLVREFLDFSRPLVLPLDAEAILAAAERLDVPGIKLERAPYTGVYGDFRIRLNGLLKLGHCARQQILDGTFCITRNRELLPLLRDREALRQRLSRMQVPLPRQDPDAANCSASRHAIRAADHLGYPVVVKPGIRNRGQGVSPGLRTAEEVRVAVDLARRVSNRVIVEGMVAGASHLLLVANHEVLGVLAAGQELPLEAVHDSTLALARRISLELGSGMLLLDIVSTDISRPLAETSGAVVDLDLAPELDRLVSADSQLLEQAATALVRWLYPEGSVSRIPIVAVTGTNGKTTTCRMIARIMQAAGRHTAMVCSEGVYLEERFISTRGTAGIGAHHLIFENPEVDFAVLEEYFGRIARAGFAFSWCNVAVCTNVTEDHLGRIGTYTLEQMAEVKRAVLERAREGVVVNAQDPRCMAMAQKLGAGRICLVSNADTRETVAHSLREVDCRCVTETENGRSFIVIRNGAQRIPVIAVDDIPATFNGAAAHNVSNAMHAAAACYLSGVEISAISDGLASFRMTFETTPGRLNIHDGLPFRVIMDYAHNADGFRQLCAFVGRQNVAGRKIVMMAIAGDRQDGDIMAAGAAMAGHFDHYVCRNYSGTRGRPAGDVPELLKTGLVKAGVPESAISQIPDAAEAIRFSLQLARKNDLLVLLPGDDEMASTWSQITSWNAQAAETASPLD